MNIPKYPDDFFSFKDGVDIKNEEINDWIDDSVRYLERNKDEDYTFTCTGNGIVFVFRHTNKDYPDSDRYEIFVSKNYSSDTIYCKNLYKN